jgi:hypothetical protein
MATHATTILDETLGSSDGGQGQRYVTTRRAVLHGQEELRVREPDLPSADERAAAGGDDAITVTRDAGGRPIEIWVRWREVRDFYGSGPRDRHYVLDHVTGTISFGDGVNGLVPPPGPGNLRLSRYRTGGGSAGNCAAGTIAQLKTTIPYVDKVTNHEPARGGADAETIYSLRERGPRAIRHRDRAVTIEDYEDLAMLASPEVARAKCVPLYDLSANPDAKGNPLPGKVSVIIVPRSTEAKPLPSRVLLERVAEYLDARRLPVVDLKIVRPDYLRVDVKAEIVLTSIDLASEVQSRVIDALRRFLHPLTGGRDDTGWDFGREPYESDLLRCISEIPRVDHVSSLTLTDKHDRDGGAKTWALVYAAGSISPWRPGGDREAHDATAWRRRSVVPLTLPNLDDRSYADLVAEARALIPALAPDWTDHNPADPGITLIELFAWLTEMLIYRLNQVTDEHRLAFLRLINGPDWRRRNGESVAEGVRDTIVRLREPARAVTADDFERLALAADPRVARAHCVPRRDLERRSRDERLLVERPADVSVVILPNLLSLLPLLPVRTVPLLQAVRDALEPARLLTTPLHVVTPRWVKMVVALTVRGRRGGVAARPPADPQRGRSPCR